ncbi:MAG: hypothetical protein KKH98_07390 [Spirochaetes bacterium]|nr:hypothetical protein [Spirochaetota bacterium]
MLITGKRTFMIIFIITVVLSSAVRADSGLPMIKTKVKTIAVFKNGFGFFIRNGEGSLKDGWAQTEEVPLSTLGSIWINSPEKNTAIEEVIGLQEEVEKETEALSIDEILKANINKKVIITQGDKTIEGTILSVPENRETDNQLLSRYRNTTYYLQPIISSLVVIQTKDGITALNRNTFTHVEFPEKNYKTKFLLKEKVKRMKFKVKTSDKRARIDLAYLQKGISWMPSYLINIKDPKKATITMKATLINDSEDLNNVSISFVVGYPNFIFADILSPMAMEQSIQDFINALETGRREPRSYNRMANVMRQSASTESDEVFGSLDYGYSSIKGLPGESEEDLFLYNKDEVSLKKGERAYYHIFSDTVPYKHIYKWEVADTTRVDQMGYRTSQQDIPKEQVWHSIKLDNTTSYPWTTAPAFTISGTRPLAQDMINYTSRGTKADLKLTVASDIKTDRHEDEISRKRDIKMNYNTYDLVTVKGKLYIKNNLNKDITMDIRKNLTGEVNEVSHKGKVKKTAQGLKGVNYASVIAWEIPLKAGQEINVTYQYQVYIAH